MKRLPILLALFLAVLLLPAAALAAPAVPDSAVLPGGDQPLGPWTGLVPVPAAADPERTWSLRTGIRKGIEDVELPEEQAAAPDIAVLRSGFFAPWRGLLAGFQEASVLVEPDGIAGLAVTKPVLVIPSGGLAGLGRSAFFRAGLAQYAGSGGVILCFSQQKGADLAALPLPSGSTLDAAGWSEDSGSLYRSSRVHAFHPVLSGVTGTVPAVETDGFVRAAPAGAKVLLARPDGRATLLVYPYGRGHIAVAALASDVNQLQGLLPDEERVIVRNLVLWAKAGGAPVELNAGKRFDAQLPVRLPEPGAPAAARITVLGPDRVRPQYDLAERTVPLPVSTGGTTTIPFQYWVPVGTPPAIFHVEYVLTDGKKRTLTPSSETAEGWFAVVPRQAPSSAAPEPPPRAIPQPPVGIAAVPSLVPSGARTVLTLELMRPADDVEKRPLVVRAAGQERPVTLERMKTLVSFDLPATARQASYAVHHAAGRVLLRGAVTAASPAPSGVSVDQVWYTAGQTVRVSVAGMGLGAVTVTGPGTEITQHISANKVFDLLLPATLPTGVYPLAWDFQTRAGQRKEGTIPIAVAGVSVRCTNVEFQRAAKGGAGEAVLTLDASSPLPSIFSIRFVGPDGAELPAAERSVQLGLGVQTVAVPVPFPVRTAGIWQMLYTVSARLPVEPGYPKAPVTLASGRTLVDAGSAAVLGLRLDRPVYYSPAGGAGGTAFLYVRERTTAELQLDGKRIRKETVDRPGLAELPFLLGNAARGRHTVRAATTGSPPAARELPVLYGAKLPDLVVSLKSADPTQVRLEIGIGIVNKGRAASDHMRVAVYEGDSGRGGKLIQAFTAPPLEPGRQFVAVIPWSLAGKAGERTLVAVVDPDRETVETNEENNTAALTLTVPELMLGVIPKKDAYQAGEPMGYLLRVVNFSAAIHRPLTIDLQVTDPAGMLLAPERIVIPELAPGAEVVQDRALQVAAPQEGTYVMRATARADRPLASESTGFVVIPTLLLTGSLAGTPATAATCAPLAIQYASHDAGTVRALTGSLTIEIRSKRDDRLALSRQLPYAMGPGRVVIDRVDLPRGAYTLLLRAAAANAEHQASRDFLLASQELAVVGPVEAERTTTAFPRVLLWSGGEDSTAIEKALSEKIVKEAFGDGDLHLKVVSSANDFSNHALTGLYNTFVLLEINGLLDTVEVLKHELSLGHGVAVIGSGERSRAVAEGLGFRFTGVLPLGSEGITFPAGSSLGVTGTIPLAGSALLPVKKGSRPLAAYSDGQPAFLLDAADGGKTIVLPFSLVRSALHTGLSSLYGVVLRAAVLAAAPEREDTDLVPVRLTYRAPAGTAQVRIVETLPADAEVLWTSAKPARKGAVMTFEVTAEQEPRSLLYLFRPAAGGARSSSSEVFHQCGGDFVSQGKIE